MCASPAWASPDSYTCPLKLHADLENVRLKPAAAIAENPGGWALGHIVGTVGSFTLTGTGAGCLQVDGDNSLTPENPLDASFFFSSEVSASGVAYGGICDEIGVNELTLASDTEGATAFTMSTSEGPLRGGMDLIGSTRAGEAFLFGAVDGDGDKLPLADGVLSLIARDEAGNVITSCAASGAVVESLDMEGVLTLAAAG